MSYLGEGRRPLLFRVTLVFAVISWLLALPASAQQAIDVSILEQAPTVDGNIGASEWSGTVVVDQPFVQNEPEYGEPSPFRTVIHVGQTEAALYVAIEAFDPEPSRLAAASTQRDGDLDRDDSVAVLFDTFGDSRTAYLFRTNALSTQEDGRIADNGRTVDLRWDAAWSSAATRHEDRWTVEFEIPFEILRYASDSSGNWGINIVRTIPRRLETSLWSGPSEVEFRVSDFGELRGVRAPKPDDPWQLIPYILGSIEEGQGADFEVGADARWRPSSRLGVDLTVNPDFALIEADVETINLSRFELRIPEKRPFFLEGNEMFNQRLRQFYSRRVGDITWGTKASGKLGRTDFSAIATSEGLALPGGVGEATADYGVVRLQHSLARGSSVGLLAANRNFQGDDAGSVGLDTTMFFTNTLGMTAQLLRVHGPTADGGLAWFIRPSWDTATSHFHVRFAELEAGIRDDFNSVGFLTDDDRRGSTQTYVTHSGSMMDRSKTFAHRLTTTATRARRGCCEAGSSTQRLRSYSAMGGNWSSSTSMNSSCLRKNFGTIVRPFRSVGTAAMAAQSQHMPATASISTTTSHSTVSKCSGRSVTTCDSHMNLRDWSWIPVWRAKRLPSMSSTQCTRSIPISL